MSLDYLIKLENFEGPMDLLLELIRKRQMNIYDLQISQITKDYLANLQHYQKGNIELTSDFMEMASILLEIKSKMLIPKEVEAEDPRNELVKQILDYKEYKESIEKLKELKDIEQKFFKRQKKDTVKKKKIGSLEDIIKTYQSILNKKFKQSSSSPMDKLKEELSKFKFTLEEQMEYIKILLNNNKIEVEDFFLSMSSKEEIVVTFGALLELVKVQYINIFVEESYKVFIERKVEDDG